MSIVSLLISWGNNASIVSADAARRLQQHGLNALPSPKPTGFLREFVRQFSSPLIYRLVAVESPNGFCNGGSDHPPLLILEAPPLARSSRE